jgi:hypothetical protein
MTQNELKRIVSAYLHMLQKHCILNGCPLAWCHLLEMLSSNAQFGSEAVFEQVAIFQHRFRDEVPGTD